MEEKFTKGYQYGIVVVLFLIWGFLALDRNLIGFLFPQVVPDLHLTYAQAGMAVSLTGIAWAVSSIFLGPLSDRLGRKTVIFPITIIFSCLSCLTGLIRSLGGLIAVRTLLGIPEGMYMTAAVPLLAEEVEEKRRGFFLGIHQSAYAFIGTLAAPLWAAAIAPHYGWRWAYALTLIPGLVLAFIFRSYAIEPPSTRRIIEARKKGERTEATSVSFGMVVSAWKQCLRERNIIVVCLASICLMAWLFTFLAFASLFLTKVKGMTFVESSTLLSFFGIGGGLSYWFIGGLSDYIGRKKTLMIFSVLAFFATLVFAYMPLSGLVYLVTFVLGLVGFGMFVLLVAVVPAESVPFTLGGAAVGLAQGIGEIFGTGIMPTLAGVLASSALGLYAPMILAAGSVIIIFFMVLALKETAPRLARKM